MTADTLNITFEGPLTGGGVPLEDVQKTLDHVQKAVRITVEHLLGKETPGRGRPSNVVRQASTLRLQGTSLGSLTAELTLPNPPEGNTLDGEVGRRALEQILNFNFDGDGNGSVPPNAVVHLRSIGSDLSPDVTSVWLGDSRERRRVRFERRSNPPRQIGSTESAVLYGWLREVNWEKGTAQLHDNDGTHVALKFDSEFDDELLRLATRYVKISGTGQTNKLGDWTTVTVTDIQSTRSWDEPADPDALIGELGAAAFDPESVVTTDAPFDVQDFIDTIHLARDISETPPQGR